MRVDAALLQFVERAPFRATVIRIYGWNRPTVSIGKHQEPHRAVDLAACRQRRIPIVRRPSGGRAVLHHEETTYAIASNDERRFPLRSHRQLYLCIAGPLQQALGELGVATELASKSGHLSARDSLPQLKLPCFATTARHELMSCGRKLVGNAQRKLRRGFLQHGSLPLRLDRGLAAPVLGVSPQLLAQQTISLSEAAGRRVTFGEVGGALLQSFVQSFQLEREGLLRNSEALLQALQAATTADGVPDCSPADPYAIKPEPVHGLVTS